MSEIERNELAAILAEQKVAKTDDGGQAFPTDGAYSGYVRGMTLLDYFAGQALAGYLAAHADPEVVCPTPEDAADYAYRVAGAMLAARKPQG